MQHRGLTVAAVILIALATGLSILLLKSSRSYPPVQVNPSVPRRSRPSPEHVEPEPVSHAPAPAPTPLIRSATYELGLPTPVPIEVPAAMATPLAVVGDVRAPVLVHKVEPEYPAWLRSARVEGSVIIEATISDRGDVVDARVVQSANRLLNEYALSAVRQWRYRPATLDGRPVRVYLTATTTFNLH